MNSAFHVLAYYIFTSIENPLLEVARHQDFIKEKDITCRVYISEEGINGQMSASIEASESYRKWLRSDERFKDVEFKIHTYHEHVFPRVTVKYRKQLVAMDEKVDLSLTGERVAPEEWRKMLETRDDQTLLLDVRNDYEWEIGHFAEAQLPALDTFREFPRFVHKLKEEKNPKETKVMMYCTGGIRCELFSALLKKAGFEKVYQLDGGIINYGLKEGSKHWKGKLFVFDDRLAVPISEKEASEVISTCHHCDTPCDVYYNCSNMDCNALFLSCPECSKSFSGCCCRECQQAPRLRPFEQCERPKPFRRAHLLECGCAGSE